MAKSKRKRGKPASSVLPREPAAGFPWKYAVYAALAGLLAWGGYGYFAGQNRASAFAALAQQGQSALTRVTVRQSEGRTHLRAGQQITYGVNPPTSGPHYPVWVDPGFYDSAKSRSNLVHAMEHGMVVIHYDTPGDAVMATIRDWTGLFTGPWSGIVTVRRAGLGEKLILTAWRRTLRLNRFEEKSAAAFIDAFRGRGPERQVR
jgi:hypothetical protein